MSLANHHAPPQRTDARHLVNWEYPSDPQQGADFLALLSAVRLHMPEDRYLLTAALPAGKAVLENIVRLRENTPHELYPIVPIHLFI